MVKGEVRSLGFADTHYCILEKEMEPTPVFLPGKSHGQRSPEGCSLWGHRVRHD